MNQISSAIDPVEPLKTVLRELQAMPCPYNERDHGTNWHASAHAWDMAMASAIRAVHRQIDLIADRTAAPSEANS